MAKSIAKFWLRDMSWSEPKIALRSSQGFPYDGESGFNESFSFLENQTKREIFAASSKSTQLAGGL
jgi:hypothetical protein